MKVQGKFLCDTFIFTFLVGILPSSTLLGQDQSKKPPCLSRLVLHLWKRLFSNLPKYKTFQTIFRITLGEDQLEAKIKRKSVASKESTSICQPSCIFYLKHIILVWQTRKVHLFANHLVSFILNSLSVIFYSTSLPGEQTDGWNGRAAESHCGPSGESIACFQYVKQIKCSNSSINW